MPPYGVEECKYRLFPARSDVRFPRGIRFKEALINRCVFLCILRYPFVHPFPHFKFLREKSPPIDDQRPLLDVRSTDRSYGATGEDVVSSSDSTRAASPVKKPDEEVKENKQFREIWALCLGLWTAYVSSPMAISLTR